MTWLRVAKELVKSAAEGVVDGLKKLKEKEPFVIVIRTDLEKFGFAPKIQITIMSDEPTHVLVLAARAINLYKERFKCEPIVELQPFLEVDEP